MSEEYSMQKPWAFASSCLIASSLSGVAELPPDNVISYLSLDGVILPIGPVDDQMVNALKILLPFGKISERRI